MGDKVNVLTTLMNLTGERQILMNDHSRILLTHCVKNKERGSRRSYERVPVGEGSSLERQGDRGGKASLGK